MMQASRSFGVRQASGDGFGIPIVVRYLLEVCETVAEAKAVRSRSDGSAERSAV